MAGKKKTQATLAGKIALVTGGNSGIGYWTALQLGLAGARVVIGCRSAQRAQAAIEQLQQAAPQASFEVLPIDLADLESVKSAAALFRARYPRLDILCNNAGIALTPLERTAQGFESQFGVNFLGHFALTGELVELLRSTPGSRVVHVCSLAHRIGCIDFADPNFEHRRYSAWRAYGQSKLANALFMAELDRRFRRSGIDAISVGAHPGMSGTNIGNSLPLVGNPRFRALIAPLERRLLNSAEQAATATVHAAIAPEVEGGSYIGPDGWLEIRGEPRPARLAAAAADEQDADRLWRLAESLTEVRFLPEPRVSSPARRTRMSKRAVAKRTLTYSPRSADRPVTIGDEDHGHLSSGEVEAMWSAVEKLYDTGMHPAITLVLRHRGKRVLHRAIGHLDAAKTRLVQPDSPICLFSASKAISAMLVHKLAEDGSVGLDERVAKYIPEFGCHGKENATVRQLLAHRGGIPSIPMKHPDPELLKDWPRIIEMLCAAKPIGIGFEKQAYHAITGGFILGELVQRVSGLPLETALKRWFAEPLGCRYLHYGFPAGQRDQLAENVLTGPFPRWPISKLAKGILGLPFEQVTAISNTPIFYDSLIPSANLYASADDAGRFFEMLLRGGEFEGQRILKRQTIVEATKPIGDRQFDGTLFIPLRFSAGFMLGEKDIGLYGRASPRAFGHIGFMNILCWADPQRDISVSLLNTGKNISPSALGRLLGFIDLVSRVTSGR
jgi:CubicO group peptidase (beta-lactamase class C family)/NAD(P)-dependent dehydrogenase (short-subunit alcohol dehydrogenase family)